VWSPAALADVEAIAVYISRDSPSYAAAVVKKVLASTRHLSNFPRAGRTVPEFDDSTLREIFVYSYKVIYQLTNVIIAAVIHGSRLPTLPPEAENQ